MTILALRTDKPEAEIYLYDGDKQIAKEVWPAHRELSDTLLFKIQKTAPQLNELSGILVYRGPGSFTGLRIGISVANSLAYALKIPVVGSFGKAWLKDGITELADGKDDKIVLPNYGAEPNITKPRK